MRLIALAASALVIAAAGAASAAAPAWTVNKPASRLNFISSFDGTGFVGQFDNWNAAIAFDPKDLATSKVTVTVQTGSAKTGDEDRDESLPSASWFSAARFPAATFTSTGFRAVGGDNYQVTGNLSLKGVSRPVTLPFTVKITGKQAVADGTMTLDRSQFSIGEGQFKTGESVPLAVQVRVHVVATRP